VCVCNASTQEDFPWNGGGGTESTSASFETDETQRHGYKVVSDRKELLEAFATFAMLSRRESNDEKYNAH
jgi:hypothetical protein